MLISIISEHKEDKIPTFTDVRRYVWFMHERCQYYKHVSPCVEVVDKYYVRLSTTSAIWWYFYTLHVMLSWIWKYTCDTAYPRITSPDEILTRVFQTPIPQLSRHHGCLPLINPSRNHTFTFLIPRLIMRRRYHINTTNPRWKLVNIAAYQTRSKVKHMYLSNIISLYIWFTLNNTQGRPQSSTISFIFIDVWTTRRQTQESCVI